MEPTAAFRPPSTMEKERIVQKPPLGVAFSLSVFGYSKQGRGGGPKNEKLKGTVERKRERERGVSTSAILPAIFPLPEGVPLFFFLFLYIFYFFIVLNLLKMFLHRKSY